MLFEKLQNKAEKLGIVGLGYVGLPLAHAFAEHYSVVGYDYNAAKIALMQQGIDPTGEVPANGLQNVCIDFTTDVHKLEECRFIVVAVPTPIDKNKMPDLTPLIKSSEAVGSVLQKGSIVVYESTVYPGVTEDICVPILEKRSGLKFGVDFAVGYSPERINPGDQEHRLATIVKVVAGSDEATLQIIAKVYGSIITAGLHLAPSIKVAEAAKVIENTQRDVNIALMNELACIFHRLGIKTGDVLKAAGTKWNFLKFTPGLVGGHCIGVDPYYLTFKAQEVGYMPEVILAGRRINDNMGQFIANQTIKRLIKNGHSPKGAKVLVLGLTFKENVGDLRNSKVADILSELHEYGVETIVYDPIADACDALHEYQVELVPDLEHVSSISAIVLAVSHDAFKQIAMQKLVSLCVKHQTPVFIDIKTMFNEALMTEAGFDYWSL